MFPKVPTSHIKAGSRYQGVKGYFQHPAVEANYCLPPSGGQWAEPEDLHLLDAIPNPVPKKTPLLQKKTYMLDCLPVEYIEIPSLKKERLVPLNPVVALNPQMSTGIKGRGLLGDWGANFAADPIVTFYNTRLQYLQWAFPGGMVDPTDKDCSVTAKRELQEETGLSLNQMLQTENVIYRGYVDDDRNTDNSWMETSAVHFQLNVDEVMQEKLVNMIKGSDDAVYAMWFGIQLSKDKQKIEVVNNFQKEFGTTKWGNKYKEVCEKFKNTIAQKTKLPAPKGLGKEIVLQDEDEIFTKNIINLYASHDEILQLLKPILFK